ELSATDQPPDVSSLFRNILGTETQPRFNRPRRRRRGRAQAGVAMLAQTGGAGAFSILPNAPAIDFPPASSKPVRRFFSAGLGNHSPSVLTVPGRAILLAAPWARS